MLTYSELHDQELLNTVAQDPRVGCLALWSVTLCFVIPGVLDHAALPLIVGVLLGCCAAFASGRSVRARRHPTPCAGRAAGNPDAEPVARPRPVSGCRPRHRRETGGRPRTCARSRR